MDNTPNMQTPTQLPSSPPAAPGGPQPLEPKRKLVWLWIIAAIVLMLILLALAVLAGNYSRQLAPVASPGEMLIPTETPRSTPELTPTPEDTVDSLDAELNTLDLGNLDADFDTLEQDAAIIP